MKKKQITLTIEEWYEILCWCKTFYKEDWYEEGTPENIQERKQEETYWNAVNKLEAKLKQ
jgi:hypothetical protein